MTNPPEIFSERYRSDGSLRGNILEWLDARLPLTPFWRKHFSAYYVPKNFNFLYFFGSLGLVVLAIQLITGIFLLMYYKPDASLNADGLPVAFASVEHIMRDVNWGWLIRYMHSTGASAFFFVVYMHIFRCMLYGSYRKPRELLWIIGILIFFLLMAEAFTGYVLPWGQMSFWAAQVITDLVSALPFAGETLVIWLRGGFSVGDVTLGRFFSLHVVCIPLALIFLVILHLLALREVGSNNPDGIEIYDCVDARGKPLDGILFHPYYTVKEILGIAIFFTVFFALVFFVPEGGGYLLERANFSPADPMKTPEHIETLWYFSPFYSMLRAVDRPLLGIDAKFLGALAMKSSIGILALLPWLDRSPVKSIRYRGPISKILLPLFALAFLILGFLGKRPPEYLLFGLIPANRVAQSATLFYFLFFMMMPWWSKIDKCKPQGQRLK